MTPIHPFLSLWAVAAGFAQPLLGEPVSSVPEIDPATGVAALTLLGGVFMLIRSRSRAQ
jgi:hypothetical protein